MSSSDREKKLFLVPVESATELWRDAADDPDLYVTEQARAIFTRILPEVFARFVLKNADYGDDVGNFLGARGQFADINPKFWKLKKALWDGEELHGEQLEEILSDLFGHILLTLYFLDKEKEG